MLGFGFFGFQLWKLGKLVIQHQSSSLEGLLHDYALNRTVELGMEARQPREENCFYETSNLRSIIYWGAGSSLVIKSSS
ncbi:hypothetical protein SLEP1_g4967 [Rubroshorea leprosula]|uniref:Uncharacterized protein n=2 Tax=Rubroshorea leprosula TaxID=152421 RepID=A0AAV5HYJ0_9ROSI|nr:hypothetical protein SLEP1_g4967 [Rubroshorea leprosula]